MQNLYRIALFASGIIFLFSIAVSFDLKNTGTLAIPSAIIFGAALIALAIYEREKTDVK